MIYVQDINDHYPIFTEEVFLADISESASVGTSVLTVSATDHDEKQTLWYTILSTTDVRSKNLFQITSEQTGK